MINSNKKAKSNILQLIMVSYLVFGCANGNQQNLQLLTNRQRTAAQKQKIEIEELQKKVNYKFKETGI